MIRTRFPTLRTLPSSTAPTLSLRATVGMSALPPLKEKADVCDATRRPRIFDSTLSNSSAMPSAKYSLAGSPLMLTKGSTAIDGMSSAAFAAPRDGGGALLRVVSRVKL